MGFDLGDPNGMVPRSQWQQESKQIDENSKVNMFYLDAYFLQEGKTMPCKIDKDSTDKFCYFISNFHHLNRFVLLMKQGTVLNRTLTLTITLTLTPNPNPDPNPNPNPNPNPRHRSQPWCL